MGADALFPADLKSLSMYLFCVAVSAMPQLQARRIYLRVEIDLEYLRPVITQGVYRHDGVREA